MGIFNNFYNRFQSIFYVPTDTGHPSQAGDQPITQAYQRNFGGSEDIEHNLNVFRAPIDIPRMKQDMSNWRMAVSEAERQIYPYRYMMQQMYVDTILDPHIAACWERRLNFSLLKKFKIKSKSTSLEYDAWTDYFTKPFFPVFIKYALEARLYGYSLISMGDIEDDEFKNIVIVRRGNINPDSHLVTAVPRTIQGINFMEEPYKNWMIWVSTPNDHAQSNCGYGLLYTLSPLAIRLKNNLIYNADYNMKFGMPFRFFTTNDKNETEKLKKQKYLEDMGSSGWMIADKEDKLEFIQGSQGKGYAAFTDLEMRLEKEASKLLLGHADAMSSVPGKLGSSQGSKGFVGSPQDKALDNITSSDGEFLKHIIEDQLFRIIRFHGIKVNGESLPDDATFVWVNDVERAEQEMVRNAENIKIMQMVGGLRNAGYKIDLEQLREMMEIDGLMEEDLPMPNESQENKEKMPVLNYFDEVKPFLRRNVKERQRINREYKLKTEGFDGKKRGLNKQQYEEYREDIQERLSNDKQINREDGDTGDIHINCRCRIEDGKWVVEEDNNTCDECIVAAGLYNDSLDLPVPNPDALEAYDLHKKKMAEKGRTK